MNLRNVPLSTLLAAALIATPAAASAAPVDGTRTGSTVAGEGLSGGTGAAWLVAVVLVGALGIMVFTDDDESPTSP